MISRRNFVKSTSLIATGAVLTPNFIFSDNSNSNELFKHRIERIDFMEAPYKWPRFVGKNGRKDDHGQFRKDPIVVIRTHQGAMGWGLTNTTQGEKNKDYLIGKTVGELIQPKIGISDSVDKSFDFAMHDLMGVILDKPVYEILGNNGQASHPIYSGMIYLDELNADNPSKSIDRVLENCQWDYDYGYRQFKIKIGRSGRWYPHDQGLAKDIEVVKEIKNLFKDKDIELLVDANDMYSLEDAKNFLMGIGDIPLLWFEEPFLENEAESSDFRHWMNSNGFKKTLYADGEARPDQELCLSLAQKNILDVYLKDIDGLGFSNWIKLMPELKKTNTWASPHAWGSALKTNYISHLASGLGNVVTIEGVTCIYENIDLEAYKIINGKLETPKKPGFGMKLNL